MLLTSLHYMKKKTLSWILYRHEHSNQAVLHEAPLFTSLMYVLCIDLAPSAV
uniref:Uncharacterized protein n=1 Tax=Arundo donax TaxID=35708 RepID=A0A0A9D9M1_ARUDO